MEPWIVASIIIVSLLVFIFTGVPIAFVLTGISAVLMLVFLGPAGLYMVVGSAFSQITTEVFIAIPLFVLMAVVFQQSGIAAQLYRAMHMWMGPLRGGLAVGTVMICAIIGALSGVGATGTITMGLIALPEMLKKGYNRPMVLGAITAGGALGGIIPPSVLMIIVGGYAQLSVGKLFLGGVFPGLLITLGYCIYIIIRCVLRKQDGPSLSKEEQGSIREKIAAIRYVILPVAMIAFLMGGIYVGAFTPTEAAGFGALAAVVIAAAQKQLTISKIVEASRSSFQVTCMIMWLLIGGGCYSALITVTGTGTLVSGILSHLPFGASGVVIIMLIITIVLGMFIDGIAISMICIPIFVPVMNQFGIDPLWFMLLFVIASVAGFITPPFGVNLFYMKGIVSEDVNMIEIYKGTLPYIIIKFACLYLCFLFPWILTYLPNLMV
ncbi:MAG: TRAP transporter large permease subunit [Deltaproteobacteria bacterium]|nr:TRAP transporter large permease subunit [Deltaproteobacteria bacterium]